jgi:hypothetical protein
VVLVLVSPLLHHSLLSLPLEAKLILMAISPTIATMEPHKLRLRLGLGWGCSLGFSPLGFPTGFSSLGFSHDFSSLAFSLSFPKNTFSKVLTDLIGF